MYRQNERLTALLEPVITGLGYELWGIELSGSPGSGTTLRVYIDKPGDAGVDVDDCQKVSQQIVGVLDVEDPIKGHYVLEVSSPGMDRMLFREHQFRNYVGEIIRLQLHQKVEGRRRIKGKLLAVQTSGIEVEDDEHRYHVSYRDIDIARLVPQF
ncbi:MAG: ribosome maturation factor RimP [Gammaproteobacteria bacterium]|nr:ribosome maturation factor RimP [Gammaproteobacteria bacterium]